MEKLKKSNFFVFVSLILILIFTCSACDFGGGGKKREEENRKKIDEFTKQYESLNQDTNSKKTTATNTTKTRKTEKPTKITTNKSRHKENIDKNLPDAKVFNANAGFGKVSVPCDKSVRVGKFSKSKMVMDIKEGTFTKDVNITSKPFPSEKLVESGVSKKFKRIVSAVEIECEGYDGSFLGDGVKLYMPIPKLTDEKEFNVDRYVIGYFDEERQEVRYMWPDGYIFDKNIMYINLPHFSGWFGGEMTEQEQIEEFLNEYCMETAIQKAKQKQLAKELEPYVKAKVKALNLTKEATKDLVQSTINALGGCVSFEGEGGETASDLLSTDITFATQLTRSCFEGDSDGAKGAIDSALNSLVSQLWKEGKYSERFANVFKKEYVKEFVPGAIDTTISNAGSIGTVLGAISEGDVEGASKEVGNIMCGIHPAVDISTKAVALLANGVNTGFTYWKSNEIEELYQVYKHGASGLFGNYVDPADRESFLQFLNTPSGFTRAKGITRFYKLDKIDEVCKKYGWNFTDYASMPEKYREIFEKRAEDSLMQYFELRREQENEADRLKSAERRCIETMLSEEFGALKKDKYQKFFGEEDGKYNLKNRLYRVMRIKTFVSQYVDEKKLERILKDEHMNGEQNRSFDYGDIINAWIGFASEHPKDEAIDLLIQWLKEVDLLKEGMDKKLEKLEKKDSNNDKIEAEWIEIEVKDVEIYRDFEYNAVLEANKIIKQMPDNDPRKNDPRYCELLRIKKHIEIAKERVSKPHEYEIETKKFRFKIHKKNKLYNGYELESIYNQSKKVESGFENERLGNNVEFL